jgi:predicted Zn-dependent protease with MMP-like domain
MSPETAERLPPTADEIVALGQAIIADFPPQLRELVGRVPIRVQDWPDDATLEALGFEDPLQLTGLFHGLPLGELDTPRFPTDLEVIHLYRMPILFEWCERAVSLENVVFDVLTHEIGHFFGLDEAQALRLEGREDEL